MRLRHIALGAGIGAAATAAANAVVARRHPPLSPPFEGAQRTFRWNGTAVAYTEAGDEDAPTVVLLHGLNAAASSAEYLAVFYELARDYHVVAVDLPGFGRSDRPPARYDDADYERFLVAFLDRFEEAAVVASGITAAYAAAVSADVAADVTSLTLVCPSTGAMPEREWIERLVRTPVLGTALMNLAASRRSIERSNADHAYSDPSNAPASLTDYQWHSAHQPGARYAVSAFVSGCLNTDLDLAAAIDAFDGPVTLVWGGDAETTPVSTGERLANETHAGLEVVENAKLLPHVEHPDRVLDVVRPTVDDGVERARGTGEAETADEAADGDVELAVEPVDDVDD